MEEFKGTPGPWFFDGTFNVYEGDRDGHICTVTSWLDESTADANGFLLAASPDLLSALQHLLEIYDDQSGKVWTTSSKRRALDKARAAVNKALGETK